LLGGLVAAGLAARPALASGLPTPQGKPILTVSGRIDVRNDGDVARFDRPMLEALGTQGFVTSTPWYKGPTRFDGVPMRTLLRAVKASGECVVAIALNDYTTEIPVADFERYDVLLALKRDGEYMPVRDKGPLFIVYPFDSSPELQAQKFYNRSAWQLAQLVAG
jgi:hypothetical protein